MNELIGTTLGAYRVDALIGVGGMAEVYRAWQPSMERHVALKLLPTHVSDHPDFAERFRREARMLAQLSHTHILPVFDFGEVSDRLFLVMPLMENGTIATRVRGRRVPLEQVVRVGVQVGDALAYAHERGVVHCDVKPGNILLDERGNCLLADFGIARMLGDVTPGADGADDVALGTPSYMAPEQAEHAAVDGRADIFALGVVLYELAVGARPFRTDDAYLRVHGVPPPPSSLRPELPQQLDWILLRALSARRDDRFTHASEMVQALRALPTRRTPLSPAVSPAPRSQTTSAPTASHTPRPRAALPPQSQPRQRVRAPTFIAAVLACAFAVVLGLTVYLRSNPSSPPRPAATASVAATTQPAATAPNPAKLFAGCPRSPSPDLAAAPDVAAALGCPAQDGVRDRAATVQEYERGAVVYFAQPGSENADGGVAYVLLNDGSAERIAAGGVPRLAALGNPIGPRLTGLRADFQSYDRGRIFRVRVWRDARAFTIALSDGRRGVWRSS